MLPWSVTARLSMPSFFTWATSSGIRLAPSRREYSLCVWRWTKGILSLPPLQLAPHLLQRHATRLEQEQEMVQQVGRLGGEAGLVFGGGRDHRLDRFLADLLGDLGDPAFEQLHGIGAIGPLPGPARDGGGEPAQRVAAGVRPGHRIRLVVYEHAAEAGPLAGVAGRARLLHPIEYRIAVAVEPDLDHPLHVPGGFPLAPGGAAGAAVVVGLPRAEGTRERVPISIGQHQDVTRPALLGHHRDQSVGPEPDRRPPVVLGHAEKLSAPPAIVKSRCGSLSCSRCSIPGPPPSEPL